MIQLPSLPVLLDLEVRAETVELTLAGWMRGRHASIHAPPVGVRVGLAPNENRHGQDQDRGHA